MKSHILLVVLCLLSFSVWSEENNIAKLYIDDGLLSYCQDPGKVESAIKLYVMDLSTNEIRQHFLPGSICAPANSKEKSSFISVRFPLAYSESKGIFRIIFPDLLSDAMGRISFRIWSAEKIFDLQTQQTIKGFVNEDQTMRYKGYWHGQPILFMNSVPFSRASITNATNHLWYEIDCEYILARIPLQTSKQEEWIPSNFPKLYRWVIYSIMDRDFAVAEDMQHNDFIPLTAIQTKGKKIRCTNGNIISSEDADWLIWGVDHQNKPKELRVFRSNKIIRLKMKDCLNLPEFILSNEDSGYILVSYDDSLKSSDAKDTLNNICNYLKGNNLLEKYFQRPIVKQTNRTDEYLCSPVLSKRGWFDPLPPEELERRKREFQASQPLTELFSAVELKTLFTELDYSKITDPLKLARTYDWFGKYSEALATLEKADGAEAKFELGRFLKHGRPGVQADKRKANKLFSEIVSSIKTKDSASSPEDYCLAGRASNEYIPGNWNETVHWKKLAADFFQKAMGQEYRPAYYYSQYYLRHSSDKNSQELLKALPSNNLEINAFIGALAGMNQGSKESRNRDKNLAAIKAGIQAHNNVSQCALGMLYLHSETDPNAFLRHNRQKAKFWLQRAAERGDIDALQTLQSDSRLRNLKK
ncbi:MAG: hypothetical protein V8T90_07030 [Victivallales bacterium]